MLLNPIFFSSGNKASLIEPKQFLTYSSTLAIDSRHPSSTLPKTIDDLKIILNENISRKINGLKHHLSYNIITKDYLVIPKTKIPPSSTAISIIKSEQVKHSTLKSLFSWIKVTICAILQCSKTTTNFMSCK